MLLRFVWCRRQEAREKKERPVPAVLTQRAMTPLLVERLGKEEVSLKDGHAFLLCSMIAWLSWQKGSQVWTARHCTDTKTRAPMSG